LIGKSFVNAKKTRGGDPVFPFVEDHACIKMRRFVVKHKQQWATGVPVKSLKPTIDDWDNSLLFLSVSGQ
jgi:hypothetical protein